MGQGRDASAGGHKPGLLGSLKDALAAAGRAETQPAAEAAAVEPLDEAPAPAMQLPPPTPEPRPAPPVAQSEAVKPPPATTVEPKPVSLSAAEAARSARGDGIAPLRSMTSESEAPPTTRVVKGSSAGKPAETQLVRGKQKMERGGFKIDPVVGWLVIVGGPGIGNYRPIFEGNNAMGRSENQRIPLDFGDDAISSEEQAYIRYDSSDRSFLFVPNLAKTNVVSLNDKRPTGAVELRQMDVIVIGRTQLVFVPFCGTDFDWSELVNTKS